MFEALLVGLLNKHLSPYVDGLSSKDLSLGVWKGDVTLKNLSIKPEVGAVGGVLAAHWRRAGLRRRRCCARGFQPGACAGRVTLALRSRRAQGQQTRLAAWDQPNLLPLPPHTTRTPPAPFSPCPVPACGIQVVAELNLPVSIISGYIGSLTLKVPWKNLFPTPSKVRGVVAHT